MHGFDWRRMARAAAAGIALLCGACGSDGAGPGGGDGVDGTYELVGINNTDVPAVVQMEACSPSRFVSGSLSLGTGHWQVSVQIEDETGTHWLEDEGNYERDGIELAFESQVYGDWFDGELEDGLVVLYYDFCSNGEHDIDLVFE